MEPQRDMQALGKLIERAREERGWSARKLAEVSGLAHSFIPKLEAARYESVRPGTLLALARALEVPREDLFTLAGYNLADNLPSFGPYLRARYGEELPEGARAALTELFDTLQRTYTGSDEIDDEEEPAAATGGRS